MTLREFRSLLDKHSNEIYKLTHKDMPRIVGNMAVSHFKSNFRQGGFVNGGLHPWKPAKRRLSGGKGAGNNYKTLLSGRNHLYSSINYIPGDARVTVYNDVEYAAIHNEGGTINMPPRKQVIHFNEKGKFSKLALASYAQKVNRKPYIISMPKRQFIGDSKELTEKIQNKIEEKLDKIWNL